MLFSSIVLSYAETLERLRNQNDYLIEDLRELKEKQGNLEEIEKILSW